MQRQSRPLLIVTLILFGSAALVWAGQPGHAAAPQTVTIDSLSRWFGPVTFPHAEHVEMAGGCSSCHHHTDGEPATCDTCHSKKLYDADSPEMPSLKVAYHERCVTCHQENGGPVKCVDCHVRKVLPKGVKLGDFPEK